MEWIYGRRFLVNSSVYGKMPVWIGSPPASVRGGNRGIGSRKDPAKGNFKKRSTTFFAETREGAASDISDAFLK